MKKITLLVILAFAACLLAVGAFFSGFITGRAASAVSVRLTPIPSSTPDSDQALIAPFWEAWDLVHTYYVKQPLDDETLMQGAIRGMLDALEDEYSAYMDPFQFQDASSQLSGSYEGIGAWVSVDGEYLTISDPMPGSPAETVGLQPGDKVIAIDGEDMTGIAPELARRKVLGPKGSQVTLTIQREDEPPFDVLITRASITVPSVEGKILDGNIAYVHLYIFGDTTDSDLRDVLTDLMAQNPVGLILDLRNNGGGEVNTAVRVTSEFIGEGVLIYEVYGSGERSQRDAVPGGLATKIPMVVLVNKWSASASEMVAGAIQDYGRAQLVGETTFGKGSMQTWIPLSEEQGAVKVTSALWLTPKERNVQKVGLTPDVEVALTDADAEAGKDPQLDKAVELLTQK